MTLLQPSSFRMRTLHFPHVLIKASVRASSITRRSETPFSFLNSSQDRGVCVLALQSRQDTSSHCGLWHRNSRSSSIGGQIAAKSQKGHVARFWRSAMRISSCCCMRSNFSIVLRSRNRTRSDREKVALHPLPSMHRSSYRELPISVLAFCRAQSRQKKCVSSPLQCVTLGEVKSSKQHWHSIVSPSARSLLSSASSASFACWTASRFAVRISVSQRYDNESLGCVVCPM